MNNEENIAITVSDSIPNADYLQNKILLTGNKLDFKFHLTVLNALTFVSNDMLWFLCLHSKNCYASLHLDSKLPICLDSLLRRETG